MDKKLLAATIAGLISAHAGTALADIVLDSTNPTVVKYAVETLIDTGPTTVESGGTTFFIVNNGADADIDIAADIGIGVSENDQVFVRVDLTNAVFAAGLPVNALDVAGTVSTGLTGGLEGDSFAIFAVTAPGGGFDQSDVMALGLATLAIAGTGNVGITMGVYETQTGAVNQTPGTRLSEASLSNAIQVVSGLAAAVTTNDMVAEVEEGFEEFTTGTAIGGSVLLGSVGSLSVGVVADAASADDGELVELSDMVVAANSDVTLTGDFSVGDWQLSANADCSGPLTDLTINASFTEAVATLDAFNARPVVCVAVPGDEVIPASTYAANVDFDAVADAAFPPADVNVALGSIGRNGTTVQIPYLTTFADYNQRLIIVNRGSNDAAYTITFTPEGDTTATAGVAASGTLPGGETTVLRAADIVTLVGKTRTAATLTIVSPEGPIDVATTQVNLSDASTDTVKLK